MKKGFDEILCKAGHYPRRKSFDFGAYSDVFAYSISFSYGFLTIRG